MTPSQPATLSASRYRARWLTRPRAYPHQVQRQLAEEHWQALLC